MHHGQDFKQRVHRRCWIDDYPGQYIVVRNVLQRAMKMSAYLLLHRDHVRARLGKRWNVRVGLLDHQVAVERQFRDRPNGLHHRRTERDVGDKVPVHHIHVDDGAAAALRRRNLIGKVGEVGGQNGATKINHGSSETVPASSAAGGSVPVTHPRFGRLP